MDIYEDEHNITLKFEVPGIDEKDIDVLIENTTLRVSSVAKVLPRFSTGRQRASGHDGIFDSIFFLLEFLHCSFN